MAKKFTTRHHTTLKRKNFFPSLVITAFLWLFTGALVYFVEPDAPLAIPAFFVLVFSALLFTFSTLLANSRRGLLAALGLTIFLVLRLLGIGHVLNLILILALCVCAELYFNRSN